MDEQTARGLGAIDPLWVQPEATIQVFMSPGHAREFQFWLGNMGLSLEKVPDSGEDPLYRLTTLYGPLVESEAEIDVFLDPTFAVAYQRWLRSRNLHLFKIPTSDADPFYSIGIRYMPGDEKHADAPT
jgi:hypothetical protein